MSNDYNTEYSAETTAPALPMKWHNFLIYFSLWAGAVLSLINAFLYITGVIEGEAMELVYAVYPAVSVLDKVMGVACLGIAVLTIITRFALAGYKANGPKLLSVVYAANAVSTIVYAVIGSMLVNASLGDMLTSQTTSSVVTAIAMIGINHTYYTKRAALFTR